jgi:hypothetical protein
MCFYPSDHMTKYKPIRWVWSKQSVNKKMQITLQNVQYITMKKAGADLGFFVPQSKFFLADGALSALGVVSTGRGRLQAGGGGGGSRH